MIVMQSKVDLAQDLQLQSTTRSLPFLLLKARESTVAPIRGMLADTDLTEQQWRVLRVLAEFGPQDASHVADRACLLISSLTRIAQTMRAKGLISETQDLNDRRRKNLAITDKGVEIIERNRAEAGEIAKRFKKRLGDEEFELLLDLLAKIADPAEGGDKRHTGAR